MVPPPNPGIGIPLDVVGLVASLTVMVSTIAVALINRIGKRKSEDTDQLASFVALIQADNAALRVENTAIRADNARLRDVVVGQIEAAASAYFPPEPPELPPTPG